MLDHKQKEFCELNGNLNVRLFAPAGSGKTLCLLERCLHLLNRIEPTSHFLLITFTRAAKNELLQRLDKDDRYKRLKRRVKVSTLNAYGLELIQKGTPRVHIFQNEKEQAFYLTKRNTDLLQEIDYIKEISTPSKKTKYVEATIEIIQYLKTTGINHKEHRLKNKFLSFCESLIQDNLSFSLKAVIDKYAEIRTSVNPEGNLLDNLERFHADFFDYFVLLTEGLYTKRKLTFEDQKYWAIELLKKHTNKQDKRFECVIIDEFQDVNPLDIRFIKELCKVHDSSLIIAGDDDQAIYEWRGSSPSFIIKPEKYFERSFTEITLDTNYRSPSNLVICSQALISRNKFRVQKEMKAKNTREHVVIESIEHESSHKTLYSTFQKVLTLVDDPEINSIALLSRKKCQLIPYQILLAQTNTPYTAADDLNILLAEGFQELIDILEVINNNFEDPIPSLIKLFNKIGQYKLSKINIQEIYDLLEPNKVQTIQEALEITNIIHAPFSNYLASYQVREKYYQVTQNLLHAKTTIEVLQCLESDFQGFNKDFSKSQEDIFYLDPPFAYLYDIAIEHENDLQQFLAFLKNAKAKFEDAKDEHQVFKKQFSSKVHLMTAQRSKGREFDAVIILDCIDGIWPIYHAKSQQELEQERRLFYVCMTRAKKRLLLSLYKHAYGGAIPKSAYLNEAFNGVLFNKTKKRVVHRSSGDGSIRRHVEF